MHREEQFKAWLTQLQAVAPPVDFASRVMQAIEPETASQPPVPVRPPLVSSYTRSIRLLLASSAALLLLAVRVSSFVYILIGTQSSRQ